jgi:Male sterility protein
MLIKTMSAVDREVFNIDIATLKWDDYFINMAQGVRQYLNNESPKTLSAARKKDKILLVVHILFQVGINAGLWKLAAYVLGMPMIKCILVVPVIYILLGLL